MTVQRSQCETVPRPPATADMVRRVVDYITGYADARAEEPVDD